MIDFKHIPVLFQETIDSLNINPMGIYIDGTAGGAGHSSEIAKRLTGGKLLSIDRDPDAILICKERLSKYSCSTVAHGNFSELDKIAKENYIEEADGVLLDIGVSSYQLDNAERGFSYHNDALLDMRMSKEGKSAEDLVNDLTWQELATIISRYSEDKNAVRIAKAIVRERENGRIKTTAHLADIIRNSVPAAVRRQEGHPARKTFQALRIEVNGELDRLREGLEAGFKILKPGGRLCVITFHSLEDRIVKEQMKSWCVSCVCPKDFPICVCGKSALGKIIYKRGLVATEEELKDNPRARSARLRVIEKL